MSRPFSSAKAAAYDNVGRSEYHRSSLKGLSAHDRHNKFINDYLQFYGGEASELQRDPKQQVQQTDKSALEQHYRFIRTEKDDAADTWEVRLAKKYYERLFREYCIADLSRYKVSTGMQISDITCTVHGRHRAAVCMRMGWPPCMHGSAMHVHLRACGVSLSSLIPK